MMNVAKFLKGCTTIGELMQMPPRYFEVLYKQFVDTINSKDGVEKVAQEQAADEIEDVMMGGSM